MATQKATTKLVPFLINNTRLKKSFENLKNLKLEPYGRHKAHKMEYFRDSDSSRLLGHINFRANESITQMKEYLLGLQEWQFVGKDGAFCVTGTCAGRVQHGGRRGDVSHQRSCCGEGADHQYASSLTPTGPFDPTYLRVQ